MSKTFILAVSFVSSILFSIFLSVSLATPAFADLTALTIRFGGGCKSTNLEGSCTIRLLASGSSLDRERVFLASAPSRSDRFRRLSNKNRDLVNGRATFRFKNIPGACFRAASAKNGNSATDVRSNVICEDEGNQGSSSSQGTSSSKGSLSSVSNSSVSNSASSSSASNNSSTTSQSASSSSSSNSQSSSSGSSQSSDD